MSFLRRAAVAVLLALLVACGPPSEERMNELKEQLQSSNTRTRNRAALDLANYGRHAAPAIPQLKRLLNDPNGGVQTSAAYALRQIGTPEADAALKSAPKTRRVRRR